MGRLTYWLTRAARTVVQDPRVRGKASEIYHGQVKPRATEIYEKQVKPKAADIYESEVKPRAKDAWRKGKPKLDAAKRDIQNAARETNPRKELKGFARKVKEQFLEGLGENRKDR